jgi:TPR repeat protein
VPAGAAAAAMWLGRACERNDAFACAVLGELTRDGKGVTKDAARAEELFKQACALGEKAACPSDGDAGVPAVPVDATTAAP